jgi:hypothetical protein
MQWRLKEGPRKMNLSRSLVPLPNPADWGPRENLQLTPCASVKEENPIWTWRINLEEWVGSKRAADNMMRKCMEREKIEKGQLYLARGIREEREN